MKLKTMFVCNSNNLIRRALKTFLDHDLVSLGEGSSLADSRQLIVESKPDLIIAEPDIVTIADLPHIKKAAGFGTTKVITFGDEYNSTNYFYRLKRAGVDAVLLSGASYEVLFKALESISRETFFVDEGLASIVEPKVSMELNKCKLTVPELAVLIRASMKDEDLIQELAIDEPTLNSRLNGIETKTGAKSRTSMILWGAQRGLISIPKMSGVDETTNESKDALTSEKSARKAIEDSDRRNR